MTQKTISHTFESRLHRQIIKVCHSLALPLHFNHRGPKIFTNYQRVTLIILYKRSKKSLVDFVTELFESLWPKWLKLKPRHDVIGTTSIIRRIKLKNAKILGDKGYDSEQLHQIITNTHNKMYAPVQKSPKKKT